LLSVFALLIARPASAAAPAVVVSAEARAVQPGELVLLTIATTEPVDAIHVRAFNRNLAPFKVDDLSWHVLLGIDLDVVPGTYAISIEPGAPLSAAAVVHPLKVEPKAFRTRRLTVGDAYVNPPKAVQLRIEQEARLLADLWTSSATARLWSDRFVRPVPQPANSAFGTRSILNGSPRSPHGGADFASPTGTLIVSPGGGRIVLAKALYYTGNTVVVDHGLGLVSLFAHLSAIEVKTGDVVAAGTPLGRVGATGRVTGPHLHWAVRAGGARIDPLALLALLGPH
jgi:murein DD-endopeptidase MepM/ murein hydrolase activator NlpD